jgi:GT2 family glycosyltransferase
MTVKNNVAAVVLNHGDNLNTLRLIRSFNEYVVVDKIAVVDNTEVGALTGDESELKSCKAIFFTAPNDGYARCNNFGIRKLTELFGELEFIIISNPDVDIAAGSIEKCTGFLRLHPQYAIAAPHMLRTDGSCHHLAGWRERSFLCDLAYSSGILSRMVGMYRETYPIMHWKTPFSDVDCVAGSFFVIRASIFKEIGYFDENTFLFYEEDIIGFKLKRLGFKSAVLNDCSFIHYEGVSSGRSINIIRKYVIMQKSRLYFHRRYKKTGALRYCLLCAATALGFIENCIKALVFKGHTQ